jgi:hypothetical protein
VVRQFLQVITEKGYIPYIIRSDRGKETPLAAEVHFALSRTMNDNPHFKLNDCWFYGTSTANQPAHIFFVIFETTPPHFCTLFPSSGTLN